MRIVLEIPDEAFAAAVSGQHGADTPADAFSAGPAPYIAEDAFTRTSGSNGAFHAGEAEGGGVTASYDDRTAQYGGPGPG
jgi:7-keto-8-aminopelargonate synthetase-like enzyme